MSARSLEALQQYLRRLCDEAAPPEDAELLKRFVVGNDRRAVEILIARHGPMVLGTARRLVGGSHDADDVFQAVFLSLARLAKGIRHGQSLPAWLHRATCRVAANVRRNRAPGLDSTPEPSEIRDPGADLIRNEIRLVLDEELQRLPDRLRSPLLLCYLSGESRDEAARQLGLSLGTLKRRLDEGRQKLRIRLEKRGVTSGAAVLAILTPEALQAGVGKSLVETTLGLIFTTAIAVPATISVIVLGSTLAMKGIVMKSVIALFAVVGLGVGVYVGTGQANPQDNAAGTSREKELALDDSKRPKQSENVPAPPETVTFRLKDETERNIEVQKRAEMARVDQIKHLARTVDDLVSQKTAIHQRRLEIMLKDKNSHLGEYDPRILGEAIAKLDGERLAIENIVGEKARPDDAKNLASLKERRDELAGRLSKQEINKLVMGTQLEELQRGQARVERLEEELLFRLEHLRHDLAPISASYSSEAAIQGLIREVAELKSEVRRLADAKK